MAEAPIKPNLVEIWQYKGPDLFTGKVNGKVIGGIVTFPGCDPTIPLIWLGQKQYAITNLKTKKSILYHNSLSHRLMRTCDIGAGETSVDMLVETSQNVMMASKEAQHAMGMDDMKSTLFNFGLAMIVVLAIVTMTFLYLILSHGSAAASGASTASTTIPQVIGTKLVNVSAT